MTHVTFKQLRYFDALAREQHFGRAADACWFIDDKKSNVEGARIAGLIGHHFRNAGLLADDARQLGFTL